MSKYVDDANADSLVACRKCATRFIQGTFSASFEEADHSRYLDLVKSFSHPKGDRRPHLILKPAMKNAAAVKGDPKGAKPNGTAPYWQPYSSVTLAGIFWGSILRSRQILQSQRLINRAARIVTAEFVHRGYSLRLLRTGWARTRWGPERQQMLSDLRRLQKSGLRTENVDRLRPISFEAFLQGDRYEDWPGDEPVSYTHLTLPTNREV